LADLSAAQSAAKGAVVEGTSAKQAHAWDRYKLYLLSIGMTDNWYLDNFSRGAKHKILSAFSHAIRESRFGHGRSRNIKAESVRATLDGVVQAYKLADRADPRLDADGKFAFVLQRQLRGYSVNDTPDSPQVAITASVLRKFYDLSISLADKALCELFIGAFFFAVRSCKYVKVSGQRKTKILMVKNISFLKGRRTVPHSDPFLHLADCISITFENQKRDTKNDTITQHRSSNSLLCPVRIWASIVRRLSSYPSFSQNMMVNSFLLTDGSIHLFTGTGLLKKLRRAATALGPDVLGFTSSQIGLHSARSGAAMGMYLTGVPVFMIMLLGRWASDAFLRYIRKQVKEFSSGISEKMIMNENFSTITKNSSTDRERKSRPLSLAPQKNTGTCFKETILPSANVFH